MAGRKEGDLELDVRELIDLMLDWDIKHKWNINLDGEQLEGYVNPMTREINLADNSFKANRQQTLLHELLHAYDFSRGLPSPEYSVEKRTERLYRQIYGHGFLKGQ